MNNCSQAPQTERTRSAAVEYLDSWDRAGMDWEAWMTEVDRARAEFGALIGADPSEIAISTSVSAATNSLAGALDYGGRRRKVVVSEAEFPTVGHVWLAHRKYGAEIEWVPVRDGVIEPDAYDAVLDGETLVVSACHAYYQNGFIQDVDRIAEKAHEAGALLYVDAYQSLGTRPLDVKAADIDFLSSGCLKFLMGVPGLAFLYVRPELIERLSPAATGWFGQADPWAFDVKTLEYADTAARFDTGTPPVINAYICPGGDSAEVERRLRERGVIASARGPVIRLAPHFYNTLEDVDTALDALAAVVFGR